MADLNDLKNRVEFQLGRGPKHRWCKGNYFPIKDPAFFFGSDYSA